MRRVLCGIALLALGVALLVAGAAYWLAGTTSGARWVAAQAAQRAGFAVGNVEGSLLGPLHVQGLHYGAYGVELDITDATVEWAPGALWRRDAHFVRVVADRVSLRIAPQDATTPASPAFTSLPFGLQVDDLSVHSLSVQLGEQAPVVIGDAALAGSWHGADVVIERLRANLPQAGTVQLTGRATLGVDGITLREVKLSGAAEASLDGFVGYSGASALDLAWTHLQWPLQGDAQARSDQGRATFRGRVDDYQAAIDSVVAWQGVALKVSAEGQGTRSGAQLRVLRLSAPQGAIDGVGEVAWSPALRGRVHATLADVQPAQWVPALDGHFSGVVDASGQFGDAPQLDVVADLRNSTWLGHALTLHGGARLADAQWSVRQLAARSGGTRVEVDGDVWPRLDASARLDSTDLSSLWPGLSGAAHGAVRAQGRIDSPQFRGDLHAQALAFGGVGAQSVDLDASLDAARRLDVKLKAGNANLGVAVKSLAIDAVGTLDAHDVRFGAQSTAGSVELAARGGVDLAQRRWSGALRSGRIAPKALAPWTLADSADLELGARVSLQPACWTSTGARACVRVFRQGRDQRVAFRLESFSAQYLAPLLQPGTQIDGDVSGIGQLDWSGDGLSNVKLDLDSSAIQWRQGGTPVLRFEPGTLRVVEAQGRTIADLSLPMADGGVQAHATLGDAPAFRDRALAGQLDLRLQDLSALRLLTPEITRVTGSARGSFRVEGTLAQLRPYGELTLDADTLHLATPNLDLAALHLQLQGAADGVLTVDGSAGSGDGRFTAQGSVDTRVAPMALDVALKGADVLVFNTPEARIWASPDLRVQSTERVLAVTGTIAVPRAEITPRRLDRGQAPSADQVIVSGDAPPQAGLLDVVTQVTLALGDAVNFEGFGLKTRLTGEIAVSDEAGDAAHGRGEIQLVGGRYTAYGQDLTLETGRLIFDGNAVTDPAIELRAQRKPREDITVGVYVRGRLDRPEFSLFSEPALAQEEQLAWLVLGRPLQESGSGQERDMVTSAALALGLTGGDYLANKFRGRLGIDEIAIGARPGDAPDQAQITLGKYLSPKFYVSYGIGLFQPGYTLRLRYDLGHGFKLQTETGVRSGGDVLYSVDR